MCAVKAILGSLCIQFSADLALVVSVLSLPSNVIGYDCCTIIILPLSALHMYTIRCCMLCV